MTPSAVGVDVGGTKIAAGAVDVLGGTRQDRLAFGSERGARARTGPRRLDAERRRGLAAEHRPPVAHPRHRSDRHQQREAEGEQRARELELRARGSGRR